MGSFLSSMRPPLAAALLACSAAGAAATELRTLPVPELQRLYLACNREAERGLLSAGDAAACSLTYEELLRRGFGGDFKRLLACWQAERAALTQSAVSRR
jgi:hypothetical protein